MPNNANPMAMAVRSTCRAHGGGCYRGRDLYVAWVARTRAAVANMWPGHFE